MPTGAMPSRSRLVMMAGDPRIAAFGRMSRTNKLRFQGDPFLGGIIRAIGSGLGFIGKKVVLPLVKNQLGISTPIPALPPPGPAPEIPGVMTPFPKDKFKEVIRTGLGLPPPGGMLTLPRLPPMSGMGGQRRRRMNPLNPRALRRALSRAGAFARFARKALRVTFGKTPKVRFKVGRRKRS